MVSNARRVIAKVGVGKVSAVESVAVDEHVDLVLAAVGCRFGREFGIGVFGFEMDGEEGSGFNIGFMKNSKGVDGLCVEAIAWWIEDFGYVELYGVFKLRTRCDLINDFDFF